MNPKISVIVPVYKTEKYLNRCIDSIINQTYKNLEIILVDDGSPDNSPSICDNYSKKDQRIRVIHKKNGGSNSARNAGFEIAMGDYITFVDSDDWIDLNMYEEMLKQAQNDGIDIIRTELKKTDGQKGTGKQVLPFNQLTMIDCTKERNKLLKLVSDVKIHANICSMLVKKEVYDKCYPFDTDISLGEDLVVAINAFCICKNILFINSYYYNYYFNTNSISKSKNRFYKNANDLVLLKEKIFSTLNKHCLLDNNIEQDFLTCMLITYRKLIAERNKETDFKDCFKYICNIDDYRDTIKRINFWKLDFNSKVFYCLMKYKLILITSFIYSIK